MPPLPPAFFSMTMHSLAIIVNLDILRTTFLYIAMIFIVGVKIARHASKPCQA